MMILAGVFIGSASSLIGKTVVETSLSPALYAGSRALIAAMLLTIFLPDVRTRARREISLQQLRIPAVGLLLGLNFFLLYKALEIGDASSVRPVFGSATILTVAAAILFLGERNRILQKIIGAAFVVAAVLFRMI
ncbi:MAG: EamA family transporter [Thermomicrobiales bacterium]